MRIVAHVDMDAFYASVEAQRDPALRDRPLVVGADPKEGHGRGVVTAASYAARRYGIRSALPISRAWRLAEAARRRGEPETIFVRDDHALYRTVSARIMAILAAAGDAFQKTSVDEAYLELSSLGSFDAAVERARWLKAEIVKQEGLSASVGIGPNKLIAKIASDFQKPDGLTVVRPDEVQRFLDPLRIRVIPGIGPKTERFLQERRIRTIADLRALERARLAEWLGRWGEDLFVKARGLSESAVSNERVRKSVGEQETFEVDTLDATFVLDRARALAHTVWSRIEGHGFRAFRTVTVTVRFENFITFARSRTVREAWTDEEPLTATALELLLPFLDDRENPRHRKLRLIGVRAEKLSRRSWPSHLFVGTRWDEDLAVHTESILGGFDDFHEDRPPIGRQRSDSPQHVADALDHCALLLER